MSQNDAALFNSSLRQLVSSTELKMFSIVDHNVEDEPGASSLDVQGLIQVCMAP